MENLFQPLTLYGLIVVASYFYRLFRAVNDFTNTVPPGSAKEYFKRSVWANLASVVAMAILFISTWWKIPDEVTQEGILSAVMMGYVPDSLIKKFISVQAKKEV